MILFILVCIVSIPSSIFYMKWFNTFFEKSTMEYFQSEYVWFLLIPVVNIFICLVATIILLKSCLNKDNKFKSWWDGDK